MCLGVTRAGITQAPPAPNLYFWGADTPDNGSNVTWQPGAVATTWYSCISHCAWGVTCLAATPARDRTWGSIKTLYR